MSSLFVNRARVMTLAPTSVPHGPFILQSFGLAAEIFVVAATRVTDLVSLMGRNHRVGGVHGSRVVLG